MAEIKEPEAGDSGQRVEKNLTNNNSTRVIDTSSLIDNIKSVLRGRMLADGSAMVHCPAHNDKNPSCHVTPSDNGKILVHCLAGCPQDAVIAALKSRGLWPKGNGHKPTGDLPPGIPYKWYGAEYAAHWIYHDHQGQVIGYVARYEGPDGKQVVPFYKQSGAGWKAGAAPTPRPLYNLHLLSKHPDKPVLIVEGEKAADAAGRLLPGYVCITWPGGSNAVGKADFKPLAGHDVVIWPDADEPGRKAARNVAEQCRRLGAASVTIVTPPDGVKAGWDLFDAVAEGWTKGQVTAWIERAASTSSAPEQEPEPLPDELLPVASFDFSLLPDALRPWAKDICDRMQCPPDFVAAGIMAALAGVIGRKVAIRPQACTDWTVICNLWALIVGRPGVLKSPALEQALGPIKRLIAIATDKHQEAEAVYQAEAMAAKLKKEAAEKKAREILKQNPDADLSALFADGEVAAPQLKRYMANDTSPASLGELLRQNPNGLLVFRDEVVSLLKSLDREGQEEGRGFYLTAWNGDSSYTFDRIGRGLNLHIPAVCLSVLGGTQPGRLSEYIRQAVKGGTADDGLIQRFGLLVWPDTSGKWKDVDRWPDTDAKNQAFKVFDYLDKLNPLEVGAEQDTDQQGEPEGPPYLRFDAAALELFQEWRENLEQRLRGELHPALESHFAKYRKLIPAIALITHLADGSTGPVSERAALQALAWGEYLETHAQRAYGSVSQPEISVAKAMLRRIKKGDLKTPFTNWEVWRPGWAKLTDKDQVKEALHLLEAYGWIIRERIEATGGRPKTVFHVNERASL